MNAEEALTPEECRAVLELVRRRRWKELAEIEATTKLSPLAVRYLGPSGGWESVSPAIRGQCIGRLCEETILKDLKAPEGEGTPTSYTYSILKTVYVDRLTHRRIMERLGLPLKGQKYYGELLPQALERLCLTWREKLLDLKATWRAELSQSLPSLSKVSREARPAGKDIWPAGVHQFQTLIEDKTAGFVGREYVFEAIGSFLASQPNGYFLIEGDPGVGKSAILAKYVKRTDCVAHFNMRSQGINRTDQFLESICAQLISRYGLPYSALPPDATRDGAFLGRLLDDISIKLGPGEPLVIAVDALDEVEPHSQQSGPNILYLPSSLPKGVYFLLTSRPVTLPFTVYTPQQVFDLMEYQDNSLADVHTFIRQAVGRPQLKAWLNDHEVGVETFVKGLGEKSEHNFMYLRYVLADMERGLYQDLSIDRLPRGLEGYYEDHWGRMGMITRPLPRVKIKIIYIMAEARQPVSRQLISEFAGEDQLSVQEVLDEWEQFLHSERFNSQTRYSLYHTSFRDFLHRRDIVQAARVTIKDINALIADSLWHELFENE